MFLSGQNIAFEFTKNTGLNWMQYHVLFLLSRENYSIQNITWSTRYVFYSQSDEITLLKIPNN